MMPPDSTNPSPNDHCTTCGMANVSDEFHPHALCLLVKARGGDTTAARSDMAFIMRVTLSRDVNTKSRVAAFLSNQRREEKNRRGR